MASIPHNRTSCCFVADDDAYASNLNKLTRSSGNSLRRSISGYAFSPTRQYEFRFGKSHHYRQPHFLEWCFLCRKQLVGDSDVFMYRGDTPFCSEECRSEQIDMDEMKQKLSMKSGRRIDPGSNKAERFSCRTAGTFVTA